MSKKKEYFGIAAGLIFLFLLFSITFIILGTNKDKALFENIAITISFTLSLVILLIGSSISLYMALKKSKISKLKFSNEK